MANKSDFIGNYIDNLYNYEVLSDEEANKLIKSYKNGDNKAREELINHNLRLVIHIAKKYINFNIPFDDLIAEGNLALVECIDSFDLNKNSSFSKYVGHMIDFHLINFVRNYNLIRLPEHKSALLVRIKRYIHAYYNKYNKNISMEELSKVFDIDIKMLNSILRSKNIISLDELNEGTLLYTFEDRLIDNLYVDEIIEDSSISDKQKMVIKSIFGLKDSEELDFIEIANRDNTSRQTVYVKYQYGIKNLRKLVLK